MKYDTGITSEVFTVTSRMRVEDVIKKITEIKCNAAIDWINSLNVNMENSVVVGAYLTGIELSKRLKKISNVTVIDIYPHLEKFVENNVEFNSDLMKIKDADLVVDTTGLGGLRPKIAKLINGNVFLVEDPVSDGSDNLIRQKNNIINRLRLSNSNYRGILKTGGLNSKTSGTMTLTVEVLRKSLEDVLKRSGVLYGIAGMEFYEGALFKEKDVDKFLRLIKKPALTVSTLEPISCDEIIENYIKKIGSEVKNVGL